MDEPSVGITRTIEQTLFLNLFANTQNTHTKIDVLTTIAGTVINIAGFATQLGGEQHLGKVRDRILKGTGTGMNGLQFKTMILGMMIYGDMSEYEVDKFRADIFVDALGASVEDLALFDAQALVVRTDQHMLKEMSNG